MKQANGWVAFHKIWDETKAEFIPAERLSDFHASAIKWVGDMIRPEGSQAFWSGGRYCWYVTPEQDSIALLWQTDNGILIYEFNDEFFNVEIK